jgi:hypothetical protein
MFVKLCIQKNELSKNQQFNTKRLLHFENKTQENFVYKRMS